jgi:type III pantothenate kinase
MLLTIDIGNTSTSLCLMRGKSIIRRDQVETRLSKNLFKKKIAAAFRMIGRKYKTLDGVVIASVVPSATVGVKRAVETILKIKPLIVGENLKVPIKNRYDNPKQVGMDRLICAYAAMKLHGKPVIIVDFGTAVTFDVVSKKGEYLGGIIIPGIRLSAEALFQHTALLPKISIERPSRLIGRNTKDSMLSGLFHGYAALTQELTKRVARQLRARPKVIITGGYTHILRRYLGTSLDAIDNDLVEKGMRLLFDFQKNP